MADLVGWGAEPASLPFLYDRLTPSLTVLMICDNGTVLWRHVKRRTVLRIFKMIATSGILALYKYSIIT